MSSSSIDGGGGGGGGGGSRGGDGGDNGDSPSMLLTDSPEQIKIITVYV